MESGTSSLVEEVPNDSSMVEEVLVVSDSPLGREEEMLAIDAMEEEEVEDTICDKQSEAMEGVSIAVPQPCSQEQLKVPSVSISLPINETGRGESFS